MFIKQSFFSVIVVTLTVNIMETSLLTIMKQKHFPTHQEKVVRILKSCFRSQLNPIIMTKETSKYLYNVLDELQSLTTILIDDNFELDDSRNWNPTIATFVLTTRSDQELKITLSTLQFSPWWNAESSFIFIGTPNSLCADAPKILNSAWKKKLLSTIYFCYDINTNTTMLYTFNPFTNHAPDPWKLSESSYKLKNSWTLYNQPFQEGGKICTNLMFDKTKHMDGYEIKAAANKIANSKTNKYKPYNLEVFIAARPLPYSALIPIIFSALNVTLLIYGDEPARLTDGVMNDCLKKLSKGDYDIYLDERPLEIRYNHTTFAFITSDIAIITQKRPFLRAEEKILSFFHPFIIILIVISIIISAVILKINGEQEFILALLEILSLFLGTGVRQPLRNTPIRIFFFGVLWLIIILSGTFQGNLASFLTKPERLSVETVKDLKELRYHTYGTKSWLAVHQWRLSSLEQSHIHNLPNNSYANHVMDNLEVASIGPASQLYKIAERHQLHLSPPIGQVYAVWWTSSDFPLKKKINFVLFYCKESGLINHWYKQGYANVRKKLSAYEADETKAQYRPIKLDDLLFAFKLLIIGISCSLVVFIIEVKIR